SPALTRPKSSPATWTRLHPVGGPAETAHPRVRPWSTVMHSNGTAPRRRRLAHITLGLDTGGQEKLLVEFARHADRRRFQLFFLSLTTRGRLAAEIEEQGWPVVALEEPSGFRPDIALRVLPWLRRWRIDVVHTHDTR